MARSVTKKTSRMTFLVHVDSFIYVHIFIIDTVSEIGRKKILCLDSSF